MDIWGAYGVLDVALPGKADYEATKCPLLPTLKSVADVLWVPGLTLFILETFDPIAVPNKDVCVDFNDWFNF